MTKFMAFEIWGKKPHRVSQMSVSAVHKLLMVCKGALTTVDSLLDDILAQKVIHEPGYERQQSIQNFRSCSVDVVYSHSVQLPARLPAFDVHVNLQ